MWGNCISRERKFLWTFKVNPVVFDLHSVRSVWCKCCPHPLARVATMENIYYWYMTFISNKTVVSLIRKWNFALVSKFNSSELLYHEHLPLNQNSHSKKGEIRLMKSEEVVMSFMIHRCPVQLCSSQASSLDASSVSSPSQDFNHNNHKSPPLRLCHCRENLLLARCFFSHSSWKLQWRHSPSTHRNPDSTIGW